jgi:hypothetical protein
MALLQFSAKNPGAADNQARDICMFHEHCSALSKFSNEKQM